MGLVANFIHFPVVQKFCKSSAVAEMGDRLATIVMGRMWEGAAVGAGSPLGHHLTHVA